MLGPSAGYAELIDHYTEEASKNNSFVGTPLRPSASGKCERELGFEYMKYKGYATYESGSQEANVTRLLSLGHAIESNFIWNIKNAMKAAGINFDIKYQQQVLSFGTLPSGTRIEGSIDSVFFVEEHKVLIDYKTKKNKWSAFYKDDWDETSEKYAKNPTIEKISDQFFYIDDLEAFLETIKHKDPFLAMNFYQLNLYFHDEYKFIRDRGIDHCALLYYNKNDSRIREIRFRPSEKVAKYVIEKFRKVEAVIEETKEPKKLTQEFNLGSAKCAFCDFNEKCWAGKNALQEYFATWPKKKWPKDTSKMDIGDVLEGLYSEWKEAVAASDKATEIEQMLISYLNEAKVQKVRFSDGQIYDLKAFKTGGVAGSPRLALKRGKL